MIALIHPFNLSKATQSILHYILLKKGRIADKNTHKGVKRKMISLSSSIASWLPVSSPASLPDCLSACLAFCLSSPRLPMECQRFVASVPLPYQRGQSPRAVEEGSGWADRVWKHVEHRRRSRWGRWRRVPPSFRPDSFCTHHLKRQKTRIELLWIIAQLFSMLWNALFTCMGLPDFRWWIIFS